MFGGEVGLAFGTAKEVDCAEYKGSRATDEGIIGAASNEGSIGVNTGTAMGVPWSAFVLSVAVSVGWHLHREWRI